AGSPPPLAISSAVPTKGKAISGARLVRNAWVLLPNCASPSARPVASRTTPSRIFGAPPTPRAGPPFITRRSRQESAQHGGVDAREVAQLGHRDALVGLMHGRTHQAELGDRTVPGDEACVGRAA